MKLTLLQLAAAGGFLVAAMAACSAALLRGERREKRVAERLTLAVAPHSQVRAVTEMGRRPDVAPAVGTRFLRGVAGLFGHDLARADQLPYPAAAVVAAALVAGAGACALASLLAGSRMMLAVPLAGLLASRALFGLLAARRAAKLYVQFPDALAMIVRTIRVGTPVAEAIRVVSREAPAPTAAEFGRLSDQVSIGVALEEGLRELATRSSLPEYRFFATALALQAQTGGPLAETLENLAEVVRKRVAMRSRAYALAAEARTSTYILAALPVVTGGLLTVINPAYIGVLITDSAGNTLLGAAALMLAAGMGVMRFIISRSLR